MNISDPGNAGTAADPNGHPLPATPQAADRHRRAMALALACLSATVLLPCVVLAAFLTWSWLAVGLGVWFVGMMVASGFITWRYGPSRASK